MKMKSCLQYQASLTGDQDCNVDALYCFIVLLIRRRQTCLDKQNRLFSAENIHNALAPYFRKSWRSELASMLPVLAWQILLRRLLVALPEAQARQNSFDLHRILVPFDSAFRCNLATADGWVLSRCTENRGPTYYAVLLIAHWWPFRWSRWLS